jgi:hypothetical protein
VHEFSSHARQNVGNARSAHARAIRYDVTGGRKVDPLRRLPLLRNPDVLLVIDPKIRDHLPQEQRQRLVDFVVKHKLPVVHTASELNEAVQANLRSCAPA